MVIFLDTSVFLKRYIVESGSDKVDEYFVSENNFLLAPNLQIEIKAGLTRKIGRASCRERV